MTNLTIESNPKNTTVLLNSSLTLLCVTNANPPAVYHLYLNETYISNSSSGVFNITFEGDGVYTCVPLNVFGTGSNDTLNFVVVVPPCAEISNKTSVAALGESLNFTCTASGKPKPRIAWTKVGSSEVISHALQVTVNVSRPGTEDNMIQYQCTASNGVGTPAIATVNVTVQFSPEKVTIVEGNKLLLTCNASGEPEPSISWTRIGSSNVLSVSPSLTIVNVSRPGTADSMIQYQCTASNGVDPAVITNPGIETFNMKSGEIVSFLCLGDGNPTPTITWTMRDGVIDWKSVNDPRNVTFVVKAYSSGWYLCTVENKMNAAFKWFRLVVNDAKFSLKLTVTNRDCNNNLQETLQQLPSKVGDVLEKDVSELKAIEVKSYKCGSLTVYFSLEFSRNVDINEVLSVLNNAAVPGVKSFGDFSVDPESIRVIPDDEIPSELPTGTNKEPTDIKTCVCSCKDVLLGSIIGVLLLIIFIFIIYVVWLHKRETARKPRTNEDDGGVYDNEFALKELEPSCPDSSHFIQPHSEYMDLRQASADKTTMPTVSQIGDYAPLHPSTRLWEVPRDHVTIDKIVGKGAFGQVAKGKVVELRGRPGLTTVAIKMLKSNASESDKRDLMKELETMKQLKPHPHVIKLLGCVMESVIQFLEVFLLSLRWSYGVVLYEIFTIGGSPYPRMDGKKIANLLQQGYRMPKPQHVDDKLYEIMMKCWQDDPKRRPTFIDLRNQLKGMETSHKRLINMRMYDNKLYGNIEDLVE
ncbi:hypothetical protein pdam_00014831 [Pocillopora damicornis]|uniref:Receptor protein-tyrosine kinase n=1 Tax=Pocillopora damicornis TaxID=46731 RepID=A0A3M6UCW5_POCDA|nr:hypothetical protein pdam_00014831 [Pocillopora damicornis]